MYVILVLKDQLDAHILHALAIILHALWQIILNAVAIEADGKPHAGATHQLLLLLAFKKAEHILVLVIFVDAIKADVHFPKDILL